MKILKILLILSITLLQLNASYAQVTVTSTTDSINLNFQTENFGAYDSTSNQLVEQENYVFLIRDYDTTSRITKTYVNTSFKMFDVTATETVRLTITPIIRNDVSIAMFSVDLVDLGQCNYNNRLIMIFEDGEQIIKTSWNRRNCRDKAYFSFSPNELNKMRNSPLRIISFTNGLTDDFCRNEVQGRDSKYFMQLMALISSRSVNRR